MRTSNLSELATLFLGNYRRQVLGLLLLHPDESFHLREIARITNTQPGTLRRELKKLTDAGVLQCEKMGNLVRYMADKSCPIYDELRGILKKTTGVADILREALASFTNDIVVAFIYGSLANGKERRSSDIDVMIIGAFAFEDAVQALYPCQEQLRREINPNVYSPNEFKKKVNRKDSFLVRVMESPKLFILGKKDDIRKLVSNRKIKIT